MASYSPELESLLEAVTFRTGWKFTLTMAQIRTNHGEEPTLVILEPTERSTRFNYFSLPHRTDFARDDWARWLYERLGEIEMRRIAEDFLVDDQRHFVERNGATHLIAEYKVDG